METTRPIGKGLSRPCSGMRETITGDGLQDCTMQVYHIVSKHLKTPWGHHSANSVRTARQKIRRSRYNPYLHTTASGPGRRWHLISQGPAGFDNVYDTRILFMYLALSDSSHSSLNQHFNPILGKKKNPKDIFFYAYLIFLTSNEYKFRLNT